MSKTTRVCKWCKEKGYLDEMVVYEKETGKFNKNGTPKITRSCYHKACNEMYLKDKEFKEQEALELDSLYDYIKELHGLEIVDGRMFKRIQDLRNGNVSNYKSSYKKYKKGVPYSLMLESYKFSERNIDHAMRTMSFQTTWNEFAYCFAIMERNINEVSSNIKHAEKREFNQKITSEDFKIDINKTKNKLKNKKSDDDLDISQFL